MKVEHIGALTFRTESRSNPGAQHELDFNGPPEDLCQCEDFYYRHSPRIQQGAPLKDNQCVHIKACIDWLFWNKIYNQKK